ncbi:hypothetical protein AAF712_014763 [Marasmius tenuissimus]|uniref:Uncharacterized protein n=1 Tax=Marasmius tenuissimus TaxID=585030 RepID=A0ABR2ZA50_9AGAR
MEQDDDSYSDLDNLEGSHFEAAGCAAEAAGSDDEDEVNPLTLPNPRQEEYHPDVSELSSLDDGIQELPIQQMASDSEAEAASEDSFEDRPSNKHQEYDWIYNRDTPVSCPNSVVSHTPCHYWPHETYDPEFGEHRANQRPPSPPFAPPYASVNDVQYAHTFNPNDYVFVKYDKKELFHFLNEYKEWHVSTDRLYTITVRPDDYPTQFANKNLHHPSMITRKSGAYLPSGFKETHMDLIISKVWRRFGHYRHKNIYILVRTKLAMFCYPIDQSTCYNMTPRQAVWQTGSHEQIKAVYAFTPSGYWKWDVDHISQVIININKVVWKDWILHRKPEDKNVYHVFNVDKNDEFNGIPI